MVDIVVVVVSALMIFILNGIRGQVLGNKYLKAILVQDYGQIAKLTILG
jgi:hypothetical protein